MPLRVVLAHPPGLSATDGATAANPTIDSDSVPGTAPEPPGVADVAVALRNEGIEVIYCGPGATAAQVVQTVLHEDADALGLAGSPDERDPGSVTAFETEVRRLLVERRLDDVPIFTDLDTDTGRSQLRHQLETFGETGLSGTTVTRDRA